MILLIDNAGAFSHSLRRAFVRSGVSVRVVAYDQLDTAEVVPGEVVVIATGPGDEKQLKANVQFIRSLDGQTPVFGIGLGMRALVEAHGGGFVASDMPHLGSGDEVIHDEETLFEGLPSPLVVGRYDAMIPDEESLSDIWEVTAHTLDGAVIGIRHQDAPYEGILFQPTSVLTQRGNDLIANFIESISAR